MNLFGWLFGSRKAPQPPPVMPARHVYAAPAQGHEMLYLIDRSGSMQPAVGDLVKGINGSIINNRRDPLAHAIRCHMIIFDSLGVDKIRDNEPMNRLRTITADEVQPRAATPLNDAIGYCVDPILEAPQTGRKILIIFTDGLENSSQKYRDVANLRSRLTEFQARGNVVMFLAANLDAQKTGGEYGVPPERCLNTRANGREGTGKGLMFAFAAASALGLAYWALKPGEASAAVPGFSEDDRKEAMGGFDDWQAEVAKDIDGIDLTAAESVANLDPAVVEQIQNLPEDFDPLKGSLDNPESENFADAAEDDEEDESGPDSGERTEPEEAEVEIAQAPPASRYESSRDDEPARPSPAASRDDDDDRRSGWFSGSGDSGDSDGGDGGGD